MTQPESPDVETHDPGPVPDEAFEPVDDGEAGSLAALEAGNYATAFLAAHPIVEVTE